VSKTLVIWVVTVAVVLALLGLLSVSSHSARWPVDGLARFTGGAEPGRAGSCRHAHSVSEHSARPAPGVDLVQRAAAGALASDIGSSEYWGAY